MSQRELRALKRNPPPVKPWTAEDIRRMYARAEAERTRPGWREEINRGLEEERKLNALREKRRAAAEKSRWARAEREGRIREELRSICPCGRGAQGWVKVIVPAVMRKLKGKQRKGTAAAAAAAAVSKAPAAHFCHSH